MARIKNVSGRNRTVPALGGRLVLAGQEVEVPDGALESYVCQKAIWSHVKEHHHKKAAKAATDDSQEG